MKTLKILSVILIGAFTMGSSLFAQGFQPPEEGNAVVYFARINSMGALINFKYFDNDQFIGKFNGKNYMRYECTPGEHLFWASSEKKDFITADVEEGGTYIVIVQAKMGAMSAAVKLYNSENEKMLKKAIALIKKKAPKVTEQSILDYENSEMKDYIAEKLAKYEDDWKDKRNYPHISADMAISPEKLK